MEGQIWSTTPYLESWFFMPKPRPAALAYPDTRYSAPLLPDLSRPEERRRLSGAAARAFFNIVDHWHIRDEDARELLGGISNGAYYLLKQSSRAHAKPLEQDRLVRISYLVGMFKSLNILYSQQVADQWMQLPNTNPIFGGRTPLDCSLCGGIRAMDVVRRVLDAAGADISTASVKQSWFPFRLPICAASNPPAQ
jgi:hypothetical protein